MFDKRTQWKFVEYVVHIQLSLYLAVAMLGELQSLTFSSDSLGTFFRKWWNRYALHGNCFFFFKSCIKFYFDHNFLTIRFLKPEPLPGWWHRPKSHFWITTLAVHRVRQYCVVVSFAPPQDCLLASFKSCIHLMRSFLHPSINVYAPFFFSVSDSINTQ